MRVSEQYSQMNDDSVIDAAKKLDDR